MHTLAKHQRTFSALPGRISISMRLLLLWGLLSAAALPGGETATYRVTPESGSNFSLDVFKTGLMAGKKHHFVFLRYGGEIEYDRENPGNSKVHFRVEAASAILTDNWVSEADRKKILAAALHDMTAAGNYPELVFSSTRIEAGGSNRFAVEGMLTVGGIPKPVTIPVTIQPQPPDRMDLAGEAQIRLRDYGLKPPSAFLGAIGTKNELAVSFNLTARKST